ncbi:MAG: DUF6055 domain-containing protein [Bacteroidales bacterium]|nr:DUF6055 domain-containing protein [Bacteroidales bacterium]
MKLLKTYWKWLCAAAALLPMAACDDDKEVNVPDDAIQIDEEYQNIELECTDTFTSFEFISRTIWTASIQEEDADWITLLSTSGTGGIGQTIRIETEQNATKIERTAHVIIDCVGQKQASVAITQHGLDRDMLLESDIPNYDMFYYPGDVSYTKSKESMFYSDSSYGWYHYKQSDHFFVFWDARFGDDPNSTDLEEWARVDIDDLLVKAEQFFNTNINILKMSELGVGKSYLDQYKMQIWLIYSDGWVATGSGYGNKIGALWVTPSTCKPVGSTIAHEIGHSFQYQVYADKLYQGATDDSLTGFRYGWGGTGGCTYWEQCAQWQSMYDYPDEKFGQDFNPWLVNYHRHFCHEWMRYQSYWLQNYWVMKHGVEAFSAIWKESYSPEDPINTYVRLYCGGDYEKFWDEYYDYASRMVTYDIDDVREYRDTYWGLSSNYKTSLFQIDDSKYQVAYSSTPETSGFNIIRLNVPESGTVSIDFEALTPGSALASSDQGDYLGGDEVVKGQTLTYNKISGQCDPSFRYGYVAIVNGVAQYSDMQHNAAGTATYTVPTGTEDLYFVVVPTPATYNTHAWDTDDLTDVQWPYVFTVSGAEVYGNVTINKDADPTDLNLTFNLSCDAASTDWQLTTVELASSTALQELAQAFVMQTSEIASSTLSVEVGSTVEPTEGRIAFMLAQPDGTFAGEYTANSGFYITADGYLGSWGNGDPIWIEYYKDNFVFSVGHYPGQTVAGQLYTVKPCLVYVKDGKQYVATFTMNLQF